MCSTNMLLHCVFHNWLQNITVTNLRCFLCLGDIVLLHVSLANICHQFVVRLDQGLIQFFSLNLDVV